MNTDQELKIEKKDTNDGTIGIHEVKQFSNLELNELITLRAIYFNRINQINKEIRKRNKEEDIPSIAIDIMKENRHCDDVFETDIKMIISKFEKETEWSYKNRKVPNETLSLAAVSVVYDKYNIEYNPYYFINSYGLNGTQYHMLFSRLKDWTNENYWRR